ncbi:MAG TPA: ester cyclase [Bryobacteraceae bacterium]|nr:ester cyclase [Bryobacteraceae bacterium]
MPDDTQRIVDLVTKLWNTGKAEFAEQLYGKSAHRLDPNQPEPIQGSQGILSYVTEIRTAFPDFELQVKQTVTQDNQLVAEWVCTGTQNGEFQGIAPTGRRVQVSGIAINRIENGQIAEERIYFDRLGLLEQLGVAVGTQSQTKTAAG